jgi:predicted TIM-barrel fold metal-dependent hydrolase
MNQKKDIIFDNNITIGRTKQEKTENHSPEAVISIMDRHGIDKALCTHTLSEDTSIRRGEALLLRLTEPFRDRLEIKTVTNPLLETPAELFRRMSQSGSRSIKIFTGKFGLSWIDEVFGELFSACNENRIPVWVDYGQADWRGAADTLRNYPNLPLVICNSRYNFFNMMTMMMQRYRNLYLDASRFNIFNGYSVLKKTVGLDRILFGTALPKYSPGAPLNFLKNSGLQENEIAGVLGKNLESLLAKTGL